MAKETRTGAGLLCSDTTQICTQLGLKLILILRQKYSFVMLLEQQRDVTPPLTRLSIS